METCKIIEKPKCQKCPLSSNYDDGRVSFKECTKYNKHIEYSPNSGYDYRARFCKVKRIIIKMEIEEEEFSDDEILEARKIAFYRMTGLG